MYFLVHFVTVHAICITCGVTPQSVVIFCCCTHFKCTEISNFKLWYWLIVNFLSLLGLLGVLQKISNVAHCHKFQNSKTSIKSDLWYTERMYSVYIHICIYHGLHKVVNLSGRVTATPAGLKVDLRVVWLYRNGVSSECVPYKKIFQVFLYTSSYSMISRIKLH